MLKKEDDRNLKKKEKKFHEKLEKMANDLLEFCRDNKTNCMIATASTQPVDKEGGFSVTQATMLSPDFGGVDALLSVVGESVERIGGIRFNETGEPIRFVCVDTHELRGQFVAAQVEMAANNFPARPNKDGEENKA